MNRLSRASSVLANVTLTTVALIAFEAGAAELIISKGTTIHVVEGPNHIIRDAQRLKSLPVTAVPVGTRMIRYEDDPLTYAAEKRFKVLTENGISGYLKEAKELYWPQNRVEWFAKNYETVVFIRRPGAGEIIDQQDCSVSLTRGETYKLLRAEPEAFIVEAGKWKDVNCPQADDVADLRIRVPQKISHMLDLQGLFDRKRWTTFLGSRQNARIKELEDIFRRYSRAASHPFEKDCGVALTVTNLEGWQASAEAAFKANFRGLEIGAKISNEISAETQEILTLPADKYVARELFLYPDARGLEHITTMMDCPLFSGPIQKQYKRPGGLPVIFTPTALKHFDLKRNERTGKIQISCFEDYFRVTDFLRTHDLRDDEIDFVASRLLKIMTPEDLSKCG